MTSEEFAEQIGAFRRAVAGLARRMQITRSNGGTWQTTGHTLINGRVETREAEAYPGVGVFARPPNGRGEGVVIQVGGANQQALVAMRDEATRAKVDDISADESAVYNSQVRLYLKKDGTIEARTHAGTAVALALWTDVKALATTFNAHVHPETGTTTSVPTVLAGAPVGTQKFLAE